jgi:hypothetical protein
MTGNNGVITPAPLTVTGSKNADGSASFNLNNATWTFSGAISGETVSFTSVSATATSADAGTYSGVALTSPLFAVANGLAANYSFPTSAALTINRVGSSVNESSTALNFINNLLSKSFQDHRISMDLFDDLMGMPESGGTATPTMREALSALNPSLKLGSAVVWDSVGDPSQEKNWDLRKR